MKKLEIKRYPASILRETCRSVERVTRREKDLFDGMLYTMYLFKGIGLAAPQVGVLRRIIVADIGEGSVALANPETVASNGSDELVEGCLSLPKLEVEINRSYGVVVTGLNERNQRIEVKATGLMSRVLQHEIDHLNGKLILDFLPFEERIKYDPEIGE